MAATKLVGILNITPDSFSDGSAAFATNQALQQAEEMLQNGVKVIDVGAESTRPNATEIDSSCEISRLKPMLKEIVQMATAHNAVVSLDTRHAKTAEFGLRAGVAWINDVSGGTNNDLLQLVANTQAKYVLMHSLTIPANPKIILPNDEQLLPTITAFFEAKIEHLQKIGINKDCIIIDAGLGFGKCAAGSMRLMLASGQLQQQINCPVLVGHSRKSMFKALGAENMEQRNQLTLLASSFLAQQQVAYLRVHDVLAHQCLFSNLNL
jgi:dihydropteroate synthase